MDFLPGWIFLIRAGALNAVSSSASETEVALDSSSAAAGG
jgi:hypothetical protein